MARYSLHGGHNSIVQGANFGNRREHVLDRQVKDAVAAKLRALGHTVYDDTDEVGTTQSQNLNNIIRKSNSHAVDLVISFHLNASNGNGQGVEVLYYDQKDLAAKISAQLAKDIGWRNRGAKQRTDLAVLNGTKAPAILIELGFIDNESDMAKWNVDKIANSIVFALTGQTGGGAVDLLKVKTGGVAFSNLQALAQAMVDAGIDGQIVVQKDGIGYAITNGYSAGNIDKFTAWLDSRKWYYEYVR
ncbi:MULTISPECIES: N-acetylmuramoyl-L-alanine amidase [Bacillus]|uniref:N-acetylmuramoyl-L-alanine amidase n=3 Tax=Bacillus thuringiensis TaxID=1428 RepID=A0AAP4QE20_BACTU|nr:MULTISPECIES: N-acetylmuramoyl-L-alanine amidase [Bacillus]AFV18624.1 cell wall hydrolase/autolysin [Bacillus thuringiensis Bt407]AGG01577.1 Phage lysin; N-acetylmuramoyl-L-alanine amidase, family 3 [Bacillus thuringiensis serovar thuringiensis str. IS5056]ARP58182.1 N-acetylmuramoyl-L-alanine amidase [Bacillus thuringiensis]ASL65551.1 Phage lysin (N-acetylmuramoyl-L-alanine amidase) [Bacillus cereus]AST01533.1 N-acetylmuramoyl-L-alanine amidase [Bacillus thuringiensis]